MNFETDVLPLREKMLTDARRLTRGGQEAEDLVQDTMVIILAKFHQFDGKNLAGWIFRIMQNTFINAYNKQKRQQAYELPEESLTVTSAEDDYLATFNSFDFSGVPEDFKTTLLLIADGHTAAEVAAIMGCPVGTVSTRLHRARKYFKKTLSPLDNAPATA